MVLALIFRSLIDFQLIFYMWCEGGVHLHSYHTIVLTVNTNSPKVSHGLLNVHLLPNRSIHSSIW